jgi:hypothetical protein
VARSYAGNENVHTVNTDELRLFTWAKGRNLPEPTKPLIGLRLFLSNLLSGLFQDDEPKPRTDKLYLFAAVFRDTRDDWSTTNLVRKDPQDIVDQMERNPNCKILWRVQTNWLRSDRVGWADRLGESLTGRAGRS